ncbi:MAG: hypothetical protein WBA10_10430 [Elainellaceae cyanobacterium]
MIVANGGDRLHELPTSATIPVYEMHLHLVVAALKGSRVPWK